jgi:hypothetical protein
LEAGLAKFFRFYNDERIHAALDYLTPAMVATCNMSFELVFGFAFAGRPAAMSRLAGSAAATAVAKTESSKNRLLVHLYMWVAPSK